MSRSSPNELYILCYDITSNKLRNKIEKKLCDFGYRLQFSVFAILTVSASFSRLEQDLRRILEKNSSLCEKTDSILYARLRSVNELYIIVGETPSGTKDFLVIE